MLRWLMLYITGCIFQFHKCSVKLDLKGGEKSMNVTVYRLSVMFRRQRRMTRMSRLFQNPEFRNTLEHFIENTLNKHV